MFNLSVNRSTFRVLLVAGVLLASSILAMTMLNSTFAQDSGVIEYPENGTDPVATYTAVDPEGAAIRWNLSGVDDSLFSIEGGVLAFVKSPNFEAAKDVGTDNIYDVIVEATDSTRKTGMKAVKVKVTNVEEPGKVTLSALQPQSATALTATPTDPDKGITGATWQWAKAGSKNGSYTDIDKASSSSYTPVDGDIDSYLRATASYTDSEGSEKSAMVVSDYAVQAIRGANVAPMFPDDDTLTEDVDEGAPAREVPENTKAGMAIGDPVVAEDKNGDVLTYTLSGTGNNPDVFAIDRATGQIMTKGKLDFEDNTIPDQEYTVTVRATDPAGIPQAMTAVPANSGEIDVIITVTDVNEAPDIEAASGNDEGADVTFMETAGVIANGYAYMAVDPDVADAAGDIAWSVSGADAGKFKITAGDPNTREAVLTFKAKPDFENPTDANTDDVYEVTVVAADSPRQPRHHGRRGHGHERGRAWSGHAVAD